jgi:exopolysaccharide production protein ExoZ
VILLKSIFFIPYRNIDGEFYPFILVGWTLNLEVLFYVIFAISRLFSKNYAPLATAAMILLIRYIASRSGDQNLYLTFYGKEIILYFVYGIIIYYLYHFLSRFSFKVPVYFAVAQLAFVCVMFIFYHIFPTWFTAIGGSFSAYAIPYLPALMVLSTLFTSYAGYDVKNIFFNYLGSISYSTYIVHIPIMTFLQQFTKNYPYLDWSKSPIGVAVIVMITLFGAALFYEFIERPLLAGLKRLLRRYSNRVTGLRGLR